MSIQKLPSGRLRVQVYDRELDTKVSITKLLSAKELTALGANDEGTFDDSDNAVAAHVMGKEKLKKRREFVTIAEWFEMWTSLPIYSGHWAESTRTHRRQVLKEFVEECGDIYLHLFDDKAMSLYLRSGVKRGRRTGDRRSHISYIRTMLNDAMTVEAGRLTDYNPAAHIKVKKSRGRADIQPPTPEQLFHLLAVAAELTPPSYVDLLSMGCVTALRPSECVALEPEHFAPEAKRIYVKQQYNSKTGEITEPKYGPFEIGLTAPAEVVYIRALTNREPGVRWLFHTLDRGLWTPSTRGFHWHKLRAALSLDKKMVPYLVTRHYFAWYSYVVLKLDKRVVAAQLGHKDGGDLIQRIYGHPDHQKLLDELVAAYGDVTLGAPPPNTPAARPRPRLYVIGGDHDPQPQPPQLRAA